MKKADPHPFRRADAGLLRLRQQLCPSRTGCHAHHPARKGGLEPNDTTQTSLDYLEFLLRVGPFRFQKPPSAPGG